MQGAANTVWRQQTRIDALRTATHARDGRTPDGESEAARTPGGTASARLFDDTRLRLLHCAARTVERNPTTIKAAMMTPIDAKIAIAFRKFARRKLMFAQQGMASRGYT